MLLLSDWTIAQEADESILVLGDSLAIRSNDVLETVCDPSGKAAQVRNVRYEGKEDFTAEEWALNEDASSSSSLFNGDNDYASVWLSVGTMDMVQGNCNGASHAEIGANVVNVIEKIVQATENENLKIMVLSYIIPSEDVCGNGNTASYFDSQSFSTTELAIQTSVYADFVEIVDVSDLFVTAESAPLSDGKYFSSATELNGDGYTRLFSLEPIQDFFGCLNNSLDASTNLSTLQAKETVIESVSTSEISMSVAPKMALKPTTTKSSSNTSSKGEEQPRISRRLSGSISGNDIALIVVGVLGLLLIFGGMFCVFKGGSKAKEDEEKEKRRLERIAEENEEDDNANGDANGEEAKVEEC
eukprot:scaffold328_cov130-Cylindrotheca_fusiformis.AAC.16